MPQPKKGYSLASDPKHQRQMLSNLALSLFEHERITTTEAKAKLLRPFAERLITKAKTGSVHNRRQVLSTIEDRDVVHKLFEDIGPRFADRNGGYTRILKIGPRNGDGAPMAMIELVEEGVVTRVEEGTEEGGGRRRLRRPARRRAAPEAVSEETAEETDETAEETDETAEETPAEETPAEETPAEETPAEEESTE